MGPDEVPIGRGAALLSETRIPQFTIHFGYLHETPTPAPAIGHGLSGMAGAGGCNLLASDDRGGRRTGP